MTTYIEALQQLNPVLIASTNGSKLVDESANAYTFDESGSGMMYDGKVFPNTSMSRAYRMTRADVKPPTVMHTPASNDVTIAFYVKTTSTATRMFTGIGDNVLDVACDQGIVGINLWRGEVHGIPATSVANGKWNQLILTFTTTDVIATLRMWLNGVEQPISHIGAPNSKTISGSQQPYSVGGAWKTTGTEGLTFPYNAVNDDLALVTMWDRILSDTEILSIADFNFGQELDPLSEKVLAKKPDGYWKFFANQQPGYCLDQSHHNYTLTHVGGYTNEPVALPIQTDENHLGALTISANSYTSTATVPDLRMDIPEWSLEMWFSLKSIPTTNSFIGCYGTLGSSVAGLFIINTNGQVMFDKYGDPVVNLLSPKLETSKLYHVVITHGGTGYKMYVNGVLVDHDPINHSLRNASTVKQVVLGAATYTNPDGVLTGQGVVTYYEVANYRNTMLTHEEVKDHYLTGLDTVAIGESDYKTKVLGKDPIAYYPCDFESPGSNALVDVTGNARNMPIPSGATMDSIGLNGTPCYNHNAVNANVRAVVPVTGQSAVTIETWMMKTDVNTFEGVDRTNAADALGLIDKSGSATSKRITIVVREEDGNNAIFPDGTMGTSSATAVATMIARIHMNLNQWHHIALLINFSTNIMTIYMDGIVIGERSMKTVATIPPDDMAVFFGWTSQAGGGFPGCYQHMAVYNRLLTEAEIMDHYRTRVPELVDQGDLEDHILEDKPISYWKMDETGGSTLTDLTGRIPATIDVRNYDANTREWVSSGSSIAEMSGTGLNLLRKPTQTALNFNGTSFFDIGSPQLFSTVKSFTWEFYVDYTPTGSSQMLALGCGYNFRFRNDNHLWFVARDHKNNRYLSLFSTKPVQPGLNQIVFTYDGRYVQFWINGIEDVTHDLGEGFPYFGVPSETETKHILIGSLAPESVTDGQRFTSTMAHVAVYDKPLPPERFSARWRMINSKDGLVNSDYSKTVLADSPYLYVPLNDPYTKYATTFAEYGGTRAVLPVLNRSLGSSRLSHEPDELAWGTGGSVFLNNIADDPTGLLFDDNDVRDATVETSTYEVWVKPDDLTQTVRIISCGDLGESASTNFTIWVNIKYDGSVEFNWEYSGGSNIYNTVFPEGSVIAGKTYHIVLIRDNGRKVVYGYLNGIKSQEHSYTNNPYIASPTDDLKLRLFYDTSTSNGFFYRGAASNFAMYTDILPEDRVLTHYFAGRGMDLEYEKLIAAKNPLRWYKMDDESNLARDYSVYEVHGTWENGTPTPGESMCPAVSEYSVDGSAYLMGNRDDVPVANIGTIPFGDHWTIEYWVQPKSPWNLPTHDNQYIVSSMNGANVGPVTISIGAYNFTNFELSDGTTSYKTGGDEKDSTQVASSSPCVNLPNHIVIVYDRPQVRVYQNGKLYHIHNVDYALPAQSNPYYLFGAKDSSTPTGFDKGFTGKVSNVVIYDRVLTGDDVFAHWEAGMTNSVHTMYEKEILEYQPSFWLRFDETGYRNDYINGAVVNASKGTITNGPGVAEGAVNFQGDGYLQYKHPANTDGAPLQTIPNYSSFTASTWVKFTSDNTDHHRFFDTKGTGVAVSGTYGWQISARSDVVNEGLGNTQIHFNNGQSIALSNTPSTIADDQWHHIAMTYDNRTGTMVVYVDGYEYETVINANTIGAKCDPRGGVDPTIPTMVGGSYQDSQHIHGSISDPMFFRNKVLNQSQVQHLMNLTQPRYTVNGTVTEDGKPVDRTVRIYRRDTGQLVKSLTSVNGVFDYTTFDRMVGTAYYVVALDDDDDNKLDPVARDWVEPDQVF